MPTYEFECEKCGFNLEEFFMMYEPKPEICQKCGAGKPTFHQVFSGSNPVCRTNEPRTFGQQAEKNAKELGKEQLQKMAEQCVPAELKKRKVEKPWWRDGSVEGCPEMDKPLDVTKIKDMKKYVEKGEV
jgi:putative FmdB family regulatory protein